MQTFKRSSSWGIEGFSIRRQFEVSGGSAGFNRNCENFEGFLCSFVNVVCQHEK